MSLTIPMQNVQVSKRKKNRRRIAPIPNSPPTKDLTPTIRQTFRFVSTSTTIGTKPGDLISAQNLFYIVSMAITTNTVASLIQCYKLVKVSLWANTGQVQLSSTVPTAGNIGSSVKVKSDVTVGNSYVGKTSYRPPKGSASAAWQNFAQTAATFTTGSEFYAYCSAIGAVLDITLDYVMANSISPHILTLGASGVIPGVVYYLSIGPSDGWVSVMNETVSP